MADRLTQLQDCLDDLLIQMYHSVTYIQTRNPYGAMPGQPSQAPQEPHSSAPKSAAQGALTNGDAAQPAAPQAQDRSSSPPPEDANVFNANIREFAQDLVLKEQQIEYLINSLPGLGNSEADQEKRMRELEVELREVEAERAKAEIERERLVEVLGQVIIGAKRVG